jgi:hypothetical protein
MMVLAYASFAGICFLIQGIFYLQRGIEAPFFWVRDGQKRLSTYQRTLQGLVCVTVGAWLLSIVTTGLRNRPGGILGTDLRAAVLIGGLGLLFMIRPDVGLRMAGRGASLHSPQIGRILTLARVIGGLLLFGGLLFLTLQ